MGDYFPSTDPKPYDIHARLLIFASDVVRAAQFLRTCGPAPSALSQQLVDAATSIGANAAEADGASSKRDFVAKMFISLKEAKETRFRLQVCRRSGFLDRRFEPLVQESDELVRILATIVYRAKRSLEATEA